jgi:Uncharacterized protein conserved in bacteria (DUF2059)/Gram-negative bacterial TonB protein C-terminal
MKKFSLAIAFILIAQINIAQDASFKADVLKMMSLSGSDVGMILAKNQFLKMIPEAKQALFVKDFEAILPVFYEKVAKIYMETYTQEDIKGMISFYESPLGKKMNKNAAVITEKSMQAAQEMAKEMVGIVKNYKNSTSNPVSINSSDNTVYNTAGIDVKPEFPGGIDEFTRYVAKNFNTPNVAGLKGKVFVSFVIEKDGSLTDIKILRDIGYGTGKEAVRVLELSPKWLPGEQNGQKVRCTYSLPISIGSK